MIYITQLVYIKEGQQEAFHQFEAMAIPVISKHHGTLLMRIRPDESVIIEKSIDMPYEIHLVTFPSDNELQSFMRDETRRNFLHLKEQAVKSVLMFKGEAMG